jgi:retinol dehydrogenase 12
MNQIALITGANSGIGFITAQALAKANFDLILIVRSETKASETKAAILKNTPSVKITTFIADLEDIESVKKAAAAIKEKYSVIDRLINNAGYSPDSIEFTADGYERSFIANHLGHFVLVDTLKDSIEAAPEGRIISVSSVAHAMGKAERMFKKHNTKLNVMATYGDGKLANILFIKGLAKKLKNATAYCLHPGVVKTNFGTNFTGGFKLMFGLLKPFMISVEEGAATTVFLATTDFKNLKNHNGGYFDKAKAKATMNRDINEANIEMLWKKSVEIGLC